MFAHSAQRTGLAKTLACVDLIIIFVAIQIALWNPSSLTRVVAIVTSVVFLLRCLAFYVLIPNGFFKTLVDLPATRAEWKREGIPWIGTIRVCCWVLGVSLLLSLVTAFVFYLLDLWSPHQLWAIGRTLRSWILVKVPTVFIQQYSFQVILIPTIYYITANRWLTIWIAAIYFGMLHFPNPLLVLLTMGIGFYWFAITTRRRCFLPVMASHILLAVMVANVADEYVFDMSVGARCLNRWPQAVAGSQDGERLLVYPRSIGGEFKLITQTKNRVEIRGRVFDSCRKICPDRIYVTCGEFSQSETPTLWKPNRIGKTFPVDGQGNFRIEFSQKEVGRKCEVRLFAAHQWGWAYPVNNTARFVTFDTEDSGESVCLYPLEISGSVNSLVTTEKKTQIQGWGCFRKSKTRLAELRLFDGVRLNPMEIKWQIPGTVELGKGKEAFRFRASSAILNSPEKVVFYARNKQGLLERLRYVPRADLTRSHKPAPKPEVQVHNPVDTHPLRVSRVELTGTGK